MARNTFGDTRTFERNIRDVYARATDADIAAGISWYATAHKICTAIAHGDVVTGAGVMAAFSPQMAWKANIELAARCIRANRFTGHYGANNRKARKIANGKPPLDVLGGDKTRAFYVCILAKGENTESVCVDRHAIAVCLGRAATDAERQLTAKRYRTYARAYQNVAREVGGITPAQLQAITWVTWRREKGLVN